MPDRTETSEILYLVKAIRTYQLDRMGEEEALSSDFMAQRDRYRNNLEAGVLAIRIARDENRLCDGLATDLIAILQGRQK